MKKIILGVLGIGILAFTLTEPFLQTLKITRDTAESAIWYSFATGSYNGPSEKTYHNFAPAARLAMIKEIGAFAKTYTRSESFKKRYSAYREDHKPVPPEVPTPMAELKRKQKETMEKNIKETEATLGNYTGEMRKGMEDLIKSMKQQVKDMDDPEKTMYKPELDVMQKQMYDASMKEYEANIITWEKEYPTTSDAMIRQSLNHFLKVSSTVDFAAKLQKGPDNKMIFTNPEYENKSSDWKFIYRSGKESCDVAREIATQWLGEMK